MSSAFDAVSFLAGSSNRVAVLEALASSPMRRDDLLTRIDASRVTCQRILTELEERGWVEREGAEYAATATGKTIAREFDQFLDTVRVTDRLGDVMEWLPTETFGFDIGRFADARVTLPTDGPYIAPIARVDELIRAASESKVLAPGVSASTIGANRDAVVESGQDFEIVLPEAAIAFIKADPGLSETFDEIVEAESATVYVTTKSPPEMMVALLDGTTVRGLLGDSLPRGVIESEDEAVYQWARETFETWRADAMTVNN